MSADRWFRRLLRVLPGDFRADYGTDIEQTFRTQRREAALNGRGGVFKIWLRTIADLLAIGPREHVAQLSQDVRYGLRSAARQPGFMTVAILTLALGIGANTAIFSVVHAVLLRPLPYDDPERLVSVWNRWTGRSQGTLSEPEYLDYAERSQTLDIAAGTTRAVNLSLDAGEPARVNAAFVTANSLDVLGTQPALGRRFAPDQDTPGRGDVAILSDSVWRARFAADPGIVGKTVVIDGTRVEIMGVLPRGFVLPLDLTNVEAADVVMPLTVNRAAARNRRGGHFLQGFARLRPGVEVRAASAEMETIASSLSRVYADQYKQGGFGSLVRPLREDLLGDSRPVLLILSAAAGLVLLLACANVANLMLARGESRGRELAIRAALGASRVRVVRQLLTESCLLGLAGAAAGIAVAWWCQALVLAIAPAALPRLGDVGLSVPVLLFAVALGLVTGVLFGIIPATQVSSVGAGERLKDGARGGTEVRSARVRGALVIGQVGIALVLLIAAGLLLRSFGEVLAQPSGFTPDRVLTFRVSLPAAAYPGRGEIAGFYTRLVDRLRGVPGVETAGAGSGLPLRIASGDWSFDVEGRPLVNGRHSGAADWYVITPGYFEALGIHLVRGRFPSESDTDQSASVVFINETTARTVFPGDDPVGHRIRMTRSTGAEQPWRTVAGVVSDVRQRGLDEPARPELFFPHRQFQHFAAGAQARAMSVVVRTVGAPSAVAGAVRAELKALDPQVPAAQMLEMRAVIAESVASRRLNLVLFGAFGALALGLSALGVYGVMAYSVARRTREIGVRIAIGASRSSVLALVVGQSMRAVAIGIGIGVAVALAAAPALGQLLFGVTPRDAAVFAAVPLLLFSVGAIASYLPARRAMRVDPVVALRAE